MISVLADWIVIIYFSFIFGVGFLKLSGLKKETVVSRIEMLLLSGLMVLTAYAEYFSLFHKVGALALIILGIISIFLIIWCKNEIIYMIKSMKNVKWYYYVLLGVISLVCIALASKTPGHYDTYLYHAQSVRWIEEYGIVKGLGNLHNRLAYNSAIFSLDALFSFKFLINQSMHAVDGLFTCIYLFYAVRSIKIFKDKKIYISDMLRIGMIAYLISSETRGFISSLSSDIPALGLLLFIFIKWMDLSENEKISEDKDKNLMLYGILCILGVYAMSIKLSVAMCILLSIPVGVMLIKRKNIKGFMFCLISGTLVILPFLLRNIIISGYLIYPYSGIDLFDFDWKMPASVLDYDRHEILSWGRGIKDVYKYNLPITDWFPGWFGNLNLFLKICLILNPFALIVATAKSIRELKKKNWGCITFIIVSLLCLIFWFTGSPDSRYGGVYMSILPLVAIGVALQWIFNIIKDKKKATKAGMYALMTALCLYMALATFILGKEVVTGEKIGLKRCNDYIKLGCYEAYLDNQIIYIPIQGDQGGYYYFPETTGEQILKVIELRGDSLEEGFRVKEEYRDKKLNSYGFIDE